MRIALAQINCHIGNLSLNADLIEKNLSRAKESRADLVIFPELAICGYPPMDLLESEEFITNCEKAIADIASRCTGITAIIGGPSRNPSLKGKNLFNSAFVIADGKITDVVHKTLLPTYDVFDEYRYFEPNREFKTIKINQTKIALTICEDIWNEEDDPMYVFSPLEKLKDQGFTMIINIAASPFDYNHREKRISILSRNAIKYNTPLVYVNHTGAQNDLIFDGGSMVMEYSGAVLKELPYFESDLSFFDLNLLTSFPATKPKEKYERIRKALVCGIRDYFQKCGFKNATLGLSGGIDSALVAALATEALGPEHVHPVLMPSAFSSEHSVSDAMELASNLGLNATTIPINKIFDTFIEETKASFRDKPFDLTEENIQSRIRGTILMALANKHGYVLLNTSNKSELAVGYGTLYGDMAGGISVIGDLYKTEVYELCNHLNLKKQIIPKNIITKAPSAELRPGQKDSDSLPDYEILDRLLFMILEQKQGREGLLKYGFDKSLVEKVIQLVNRSEFKRFQFAPILRVSTKAFGSGRRMPLVAKYT
ncbi:MAG: NAD+ synthase [Bacteroidota bacterium]